VLHGRLSLHGIEDAEAFCRNIAHNAELPNYHDREDLLAYLIAELWILSTRYEPGGISFSTWAGHTLRQRTHDWKRQRYGRTTWQFKDRTHTRTLPTLVSIDAHPGDDRPLPSPNGDSSAHSVSDLAGLLRTRGSTEAWDNHPDRPRLPRRTED
jgi:DNA-directed RNA polymerase specialized sigma24 family protein